MTVSSINYAVLEEIWGESFDNTTNIEKKKKKKKSMDPLCQVYAKKPSKFDDIMDTYNSSNHEVYDKVQYSRTHHPLPDTDADEREMDKYLGIKDKQMHSLYQTKEGFESNDIFDKKEQLYLDFAMYIFSGIVLIFILEQFVQLGMAIKK